MARETPFLKLKLYDAVEDSMLPNKDVVTGVFGYEHSNMSKIDTAVQKLDEKQKEVITNQQIDSIFDEPIDVLVGKV